MSESWQQWRQRQLAKPLKIDVDRIKVIIQVGPIEIGCKFQPAFDPRFEVCIYHSETRKAHGSHN